MSNSTTNIAPKTTTSANDHVGTNKHGCVPPADPTIMRYYNLSRHWTKRIVPHLADEQLNKILVHDFNKFTWGRWRQRFERGKFPADFESCDWACEHRGRRPRYWHFVKHAACHWLVNFALRLACLAEPNRKWRIVSSESHSTVWDGEHSLFDFNFQAMNIPAAECWEQASKGGEQLTPGKLLKVHFAEHYSFDVCRNRQMAASSLTPTDGSTATNP
jgi:hypothetical protein